MNTEGIYDEYQSASIAIDALSDALRQATPFERPSIRRALIEAAQARMNLGFELMDAIEADMKKEAA
jgi:hypothetical protein